MVNKTPLVSVIMSVYDGLELKYLCAAAESILTQTYSNLEFLIVLDGVKREDIRKSLEDLKKSDCRVRLIHFADNKGLADALEELAADAELCREMGKNARTLAEREFDRAKLADRLESVLLEAVEQS